MTVDLRPRARVRGAGEPEAGLLAVRRTAGSSTGGDPLNDPQPGHGERLAEVGTAGRATTWSARSPRRAGRRSTGARCPGAERAQVPVPDRAGRGRAGPTSWPCWRPWTTDEPIRESRDVDVPTAAAHLRSTRRLGRQAGVRRARARAAAGGRGRRGVPWNCPSSCRLEVAPALATGNTIVLEPAETTPLTALVLAEIAAEAGLPDGVLNVLPGAGDVGAAVVGTRASPRSRSPGPPTSARRSSGGSRAPGSGSRSSSAARRPTSCYDDAALDQAVEGIVEGIFFNQGHVCCAGSRLLVQESVADELMELLRARIATLRVGDPLDKNTDVGAINSRAQLDRIVDLAAAGDAEGARRWTSPCPLPERGLFFPPTVFSDVEQTMRVAREEIFGPVLSVLTFRTPAEAVAKANNTPYGLSAGVWTDKGAKALWTAQRCAPGWCGRTRSTGSTRRARSAGSANRASAARADGQAWRPTSTREGRGSAPAPIRALDRRGRASSVSATIMLAAPSRLGDPRSRSPRRSVDGALGRVAPSSTASRCSGSPCESYGPTGTAAAGRQPREHDREPYAALQRRGREGLVSRTTREAGPPRACPGGRRRTARGRGTRSRTVRERVDTHNRLDQRTAAGDVQRGAHR